MARGGKEKGARRKEGGGGSSRKRMGARVMSSVATLTRFFSPPLMPPIPYACHTKAETK
jgi:hypothetical protein